MDKIKEIIINLINCNAKLKNAKNTIIRFHIHVRSIPKTIGFVFKELLFGYKPIKTDSIGKQYLNLFKKVKIKIDDDNNFVFNLDQYKILSSDLFLYENTTVDYSIILNKSLKQMKEENNKLKDCNYKENQKYTLEAIDLYIDRIVNDLKNSNKNNKENLSEYFENIKNSKVTGFEEALQRILFYNSLLWQTGHCLNGLGRLDKMLIGYYNNDIESKKITKEDSVKLIDDFIKSLHKFYESKSNTILGDTGQIIILGGSQIDGNYYENDLTEIFIQEIKKLQLPDPKVLLRVSNKTPRNLIKLSVDTIKTGIGCPLFANDDIIIPKLIEFGYDKEKAYDYITSACWEPLIPTESVEQNNMSTLIFIKPFNELFDNADCEKYTNIDEIIADYKEYLKKYIIVFIKELDSRKYQEEPLMSLFVPNCNLTLKDVTEGGAIYNNYGATTVSLANVINSLLNINYFVFDKKEISLEELNKARKNNFENNEELLKKLKDQKLRFGADDEKVYNIANEIMDFTNEVLKETPNKWGGHLKIGYSAPTYITDGNKVSASFDGRKNGEPFIVHISSDIPSLPYTELVNFASKLDYTGNRFNGNVVDFMVSPSFIEKNEEKFIDFIIASINIGFFEMQMNVVSSDTLIKAKANPNEFPNLIVRVWGFSAYFNDLPEEYKDVLIERALKAEGKI